MRFSTFLSLSSTYLAWHAASAALPRAEQTLSLSQDNSNARVIYQFSNGTWIENIAARANGNLLVTLIDRPEIYEINPYNAANPALVHRFPGYTSVLGISETSPDVFAVIAGNYSNASGGQAGSFAIWSVGFIKGNSGAQVAKVTDIPEAVFLNGLTTLDKKAGTILVSDSARGLVLRVDTQSRQYATVLDNEAFKPAPGAIPLGINGIRALDGYLYYTNTFKPLFGRVAVDRHTGKAVGPFQTINSNVAGDDFALDNNRVAYIAANPQNEVIRVDQRGNTKVLAGDLNSTLVPGPTSAVFGRRRGRHGKQVLYVSTSGGSAAPVNGTYSEGGKVLALDV